MKLLALFVIVPLIEIALFIQVGGVIGLWPTLAIVVITAVIGTTLVRAQGALAISQLRGSLNELRDPSEPLAHGAMILLAGALLLTPGFFTDAVGFALLVPGLRGAAFRYLRSRIRVERFTYGDAPGPQDPRRPGGPGGPQAPRGTPAAPGRGEVIEGEYEVADPPKKAPTHSAPRGPSGWTRH